MSCIVGLGAHSVKTPQKEKDMYVTNSVQFRKWIFLPKCVSDVVFIKKWFSKPL